VKILACPVAYWPKAQESWKTYLPGIEVIYIDKENLRSYWNEIAERWGRSDLLLIEQDIVVHRSVLPQFMCCNESWCLFPFNGQNWGLGCTRFRKEFQQKVTIDVLRQQVDYCDYCKGEDATCWWHIDGKVLRAGEALGFKRHEHYPQVGHRDFAGGEMYLNTVQAP
jgi:hypothetical protein